jgi:hypothetical protein
LSYSIQFAFYSCRIVSSLLLFNGALGRIKAIRVHLNTDKKLLVCLGGLLDLCFVYLMCNNGDCVRNGNSITIFLVNAKYIWEQAVHTRDGTFLLKQVSMCSLAS